MNSSMSEIAIHESLKCSAANGVLEHELSSADATQAKKGINDRLAVELLQTLIRAVPKASVPERVAGANAISHLEVSDIVISNQFNLRYLCRQWKAIVEKLTPLHLNCYACTTDYSTSLCDPSNVFVASLPRSLEKIAAFPECSLASFKSLSEYVNNLHFELDYSSNYVRTLSVAAVLNRISLAVQQPCGMSLGLGGYGVDCVSHLVKDYDIPFHSQFPDISMEKLQFSTRRNYYAEVGLFEIENRCLQHFLEPAKSSLLELEAPLQNLNAVFAEVGVNEGPGLLPADWVCESLKKLELQFIIDWNDRDSYEYNDATRARAYAIFAKVAGWFPNLRKLTFEANRPQIDFSVLNQLNGLRSLKLSYRDDDHLRTDSNIPALPGVASLAFENGSLFPISSIAPNMTKFKLIDSYAKSFADLRQEIMKSEANFVNLRKLVIKRTERDSNPATTHAPSQVDLILLLQSLGKLRTFVSLKIEGFRYNSFFDKWSPSGDLSLVQSLPENLRKARFIDCLRPTGVRYDEQSRTWLLDFKKEVPLAEESIYKDWLRLLLCHLSEHPSLEHFHCVSPAPSFEAIRVLADRWSLSSVDAIADLGLSCVLSVSCTPSTVRANGERIPTVGNRFKFRFILGRSAIVKAAHLKDLAMPTRKFVTVDFYNPSRA